MHVLVLPQFLQAFKWHQFSDFDFSPVGLKIFFACSVCSASPTIASCFKLCKEPRPQATPRFFLIAMENFSPRLRDNFYQAFSVLFVLQATIAVVEDWERGYIPMLLSLKLQAHTGAIERTGFLRIKSQLRPSAYKLACVYLVYGCH